MASPRQIGEVDQPATVPGASIQPVVPGVVLNSSTARLRS